MTTRHSVTILAAAAAVAVLAGCASPSAPRTAAAAAPAPAAPSTGTAPAAAAPSPSGTTAAAGGSSSRSTPLASTAVPPAAVALAQPENASVFFDFDDTRMKQADLAVIERYGRYLVAAAAVNARVEGHADERGSREYNLALGQRRAQSVVDALKVLGVADSRVEAVSYGEERPRVRDSNEAAWAQNRRADLSLKR